MFAVNHALGGALIGLTITNPVIAVPLAFASHFVLDTLPHYGSAMHDKELFKTKHFSYRLALEAFLCFVIVLLLAISQPKSWFTAAVCAFIAASPDLFWFGKFVRLKNSQSETKQPNFFLRFHAWIQWYAKPLGSITELTAFMVFGILFFNLL